MSAPPPRSTRADRLLALHAGPRPLLLPNAWDVASARTLEELGARAVATSSAGVAASHGWADGEDMPVGEMLRAVSRIAAAVSIPVTADMESGYGLSPSELAERLLEAGAVGLNLEDSNHGGGEPLLEPARQAERIAAVKAAARALGAELVLNARVDVFLRATGDPASRLDEALRRARAYRGAGADCIFPIRLADEATIAALVHDIEAPLNILAGRAGPAPARLAELGVARISFGSGPMRAALEHFRSAAAALLAGGDGEGLSVEPPQRR